MNGESAVEACVRSRLPEGQPEAGVWLDQLGGIVDEHGAEHETDFGEHECGERVAVFQDQFFAAFHRAGERTIAKHQALPFPVFIADQLVKIGPFGAGVHHDFSPRSDAPVSSNGWAVEKVELFFTSRLLPRILPGNS